MKKVFVCCEPEEKSLGYAAIVRRGGVPIDPSPILNVLPQDIGEEAKAGIIKESISEADEVWVIGDKTPDESMGKMIESAAKPVKNVLFETTSAPAPAPAPAPKLAMSLIYKDTAQAADNFTAVFADEGAAFEYMQTYLTALAESGGNTCKIADDKKSGYIAQERKLICTAYLLPIA